MEGPLSTGKAAKLLGVSIKTLHHWEREAQLVLVAQAHSNRHPYTEAHIFEFIRLQNAGI